MTCPLAWQRKLDTTTYIDGVNCIFYSHHAPMPRSYYPFLMQNCIALQKLETQDDDKLRATSKRPNLLNFNINILKLQSKHDERQTFSRVGSKIGVFTVSSSRFAVEVVFEERRTSVLDSFRTHTELGSVFDGLCWPEECSSPAPNGRGRARRVPDSSHTPNASMTLETRTLGWWGQSMGKNLSLTNYITVVRK